MSKIFVDVVVKHTKEGVKVPLTVIWEDGRRYNIDKVKDITQAAALKAGGRGIRYKCSIQGHETCLWQEDNKWFVDSKKHLNP